MKSPHIHHSDHEAAMHRLITPSARIVSATVILIAGLGIATVFWKMPTGNENHALYDKGMIDKTIAGAPLPDESIALLSLEERSQISLPMFDIAPATDCGTAAYTQLYEPPPSLVAMLPEQEQIVSTVAEELLAPQKFEPMRQITDEKPISIEPVNKDFQPKPPSVSTIEKSDEMISRFLFAENSRSALDTLAEPQPPTDPFPMVSVPMPVLQPLKPLYFEDLTPLHPLQSTVLQAL